MPSPLRSDPYLKRLYNRYNRLYFDNRLPQETLVRWRPQTEMREGKHTLWGVAYYVSTGKEDVPFIDLNRIMKKWGSARNGTLLHEMVHLENWRASHSKKKFDKFDEGMLRIAKMGALHGIW